MEGARTAVLPLLLMLERLGGPVRRAVLVLLATAALSAGVVLEGLRVSTWRRRTLRQELRRSLRQSLAGGFGTVLVTAAIVGFGMVYQATTWLAYAGQEGLAGRILVVVLVREVTPVLVGLILLGRSGTVAVVEFGETKASGQLGVLQVQGMDPFALLFLPRVVAMAVAGFTLGVVFLTVAIAVGFVSGQLLGAVQSSGAEQIENLLEAAGPREFVLFAVKTTLVGALVAVVCGITGMSSTRAETPSHLLPRGFVRGLFAVLVTSATLTVVAT
jgi:phospholipid/cholesterol/gamma-HCH transport system permease protein